MILFYKRPISGQSFELIWPYFTGLRQKDAQKQPKFVLSAGIKTIEISKLEMKITPDIYHLKTFNIRKHDGVKEWTDGGTTKKPAENVMKLREYRLSHHLKPVQKMLKQGCHFVKNIRNTRNCQKFDKFC